MTDITSKAHVRSDNNLLLSFLGLCAVIVLVFVVISEIKLPGYGYASRLVRSTEAVELARRQHQAELADARFLEVERKFVTTHSVFYTGVACPAPGKWAEMSETDKARWHAYFQKQNLPLIGNSEICYDP